MYDWILLEIQLNKYQINKLIKRWVFGVNGKNAFKI